MGYLRHQAALGCLPLHQLDCTEQKKTTTKTPKYTGLPDAMFCHISYHITSIPAALRYCKDDELSVCRCPRLTGNIIACRRGCLPKVGRYLGSLGKVLSRDENLDTFIRIISAGSSTPVIAVLRTECPYRIVEARPIFW